MQASCLKTRHHRKNVQSHLAFTISVMDFSWNWGGGGGGGGGAVAQSVERATPGEDVPGSIPAVAAHSLPVESVSV